MKILEIYKNILLEDFKSQRKKFIEQGYELEIVDTYLKDFDEIRKAKYREARDAEIEGLNVPKGEPRFNVDNYKTFRELEILVDYVAGQRRVGSANFEDIKVEGEPIFRNEDVEIYYADTPRACIQYKGNFPYSWCVARNNSGNMFYYYRLQQKEPAFYFVKLTKRTKKEFEYWNTKTFNGSFKDRYHFFVMQVTKYGEYVVTSANNDGDIKMEWDKILTFAPELTNLKHIFQPKPLTKEEREKIEKYKNGLSDEEFAKLSYKEKDFYLSVYNKQITFEQFKILPEDLKNKYIGFGIGLSDEQFEIIKNNKNLIKRYSEITKRKFDEFAKNNFRNSDFTKSEELFIQDEIDKLIDEKGDKLNSDNIDLLLVYSSKKDELIDKIIIKKGDRLSSFEIIPLLKYSSKKDELIDYYINLKRDNITYSEINILLVYSSKKDELIDYYINLKGDKLDNDDINLLLYNSSKKDELIDYYFNLKRDNITYSEINILLVYSTKKDELIDYYINLKGNELNVDDIQILLPFSSKKDELIDYYINLKKDGLNFYQISILLLYSSKKDDLIKKVIYGGVSKKEINAGIRLYNYDNTPNIPLIPNDELNEQITRIHTLLKII